MADEVPTELPLAEPDGLAPGASLDAPCRHLRNKDMYVFSDTSSENTGLDDDHSLYWCLQTMKNFGPDDDMVSGRECRNSSRSCYEPL
jgi:hypothetical protein